MDAQVIKSAGYDDVITIKKYKKPDQLRKRLSRENRLREKIQVNVKLRKKENLVNDQPKLTSPTKILSFPDFVLIINAPSSSIFFA